MNFPVNNRQPAYFDQDGGLLLAAVCYAARLHRLQRRKDAEKTPYINHPLEVAQLLWDGGVHRAGVLAAAVLHDTLEDTSATEQQLIEHFGVQVTGWVKEVTDDKTLPKAVRKRLQIEHASLLSREAKLIKLADKISNITAIIETPPADWSLQRKREYLDWAQAVVDGLGEVNTRLLQQFHSILCRGRRVLAAAE